MQNKFLINQFYVLVCLFAKSASIPTQPSLLPSPPNGARGGRQTFRIYETEPPTSSGEPITFAEGLNLICRVNTTSRHCPTVNWSWERHGEKEWRPYNPKENVASSIQSSQITLTSMDNMRSEYTCVAKCYNDDNQDLGPRDNRTFFIKPEQDHPTILVEKIKDTNEGKGLMITVLSTSLLLLLLLGCRFLKSEKGKPEEMRLDKEEVEIFFKGRTAPSQDAEGEVIQLQDIPEEIGDSLDSRSTTAIEDYELPAKFDYSTIPYDDSKEIPFKKLKFIGGYDNIIGGGHFGEVRLATYKNQQVAVKSIRKDSSMSRAEIKAAFLNFIRKEIKIIQKIQQDVGSHENIVGYVGAVTKKMKKKKLRAYLILEYCIEGDLASYLERNRLQFQIVRRWSSPSTNPSSLFNTLYFNTFHLLKWCKDIASGLSCLANLRIPHGDLAARNIMLGQRDANLGSDSEPSNLVAKIGDFGLSRMLPEGGPYYYRWCDPNDPNDKGRVVPTRSLAPEALANQKLTLETDIWALGVLYWEMFTFGRIPYGDLRDGPVLPVQFQIFNYLQRGGRLGRPSNAPDKIWDIMRRCWAWHPNRRPKINQIVKEFEELEADVLNETWLVNSGEEEERELTEEETEFEEELKGGHENTEENKETEEEGVANREELISKPIILVGNGNNIDVRAQIHSTSGGED